MMAKKNKGETPMDAALSFLTARARTVREVEDMLDSKNFGEQEVYEVVERLRELGYLNDEKYAAEFIETRLATKPLSRRKLREQLYKHKLQKDVISEALLAVTDEVENEGALLTAKKYDRQFAHLDQGERKQRVMRRLVARGYEYSAMRAALDSVFGDSYGLDECDAQYESDDDD